MSIIYLWNPYLNCENTFGHFKQKLVKVYLALTGNICVCAAPVRGLFCGFEMCGDEAHLSSLRPSSRLRNSKILALCSLFLSAESLAPIADTDTAAHGEQEPAISMGSPGFTTTFIRWSKRERKRGGGKPIRSAILTAWITIIICWASSYTWDCREKNRPGQKNNMKHYLVLRPKSGGHSRPLVCLAKLPRRRRASLKSPQWSSRQLS